MKDYQRLPHTLWECKYHIVFIPKYRRKTLFAALRKDLGPVLRELARREGCQVEEGHLRSDHVHMLVSIPPKYAVAAIVGYLKGKSAIHIARTYRGKARNFTGEHCWARGYGVSTVGADEAAIREYIRAQEQADIRLDQLQLFK
jgi:REP-associated tyrosine transposase